MKLQEIIQKVAGKDNIFNYESYSQYLKAWGDWYTGKVKDFHWYKYYNGIKMIEYERMTLGMAKKICEDWANLLINEKTDIVLSNDTSQKALESIFEECDFWQKANDGVEKIFALGGGAFVVSVDNISVGSNGNIKQDGKINVTFCNANKIRPITIEDGKVTECAFIRVDTDTTYVSVHYKDKDGIYKIHNLIARGKDENSLTIDAESEYVFDTKSKDPWFCYLRPNISNNIDIDSPLGVSVFANAIDTLKEIDIVYDSYANEFLLGRKRIFVKASSAKVDLKSGEIQETFDARDGAFYALPEDDDGSTFIQSDTQSLRINEHQTGLQDQLNVLSSKCGMGTEHYKFDKGGIATATQIISENSDMFRNIKRHEIFIEKALKIIVNAIIYASNTFTATKITSDGNIEVKFDDSIIEDKTTERTQDRLDVSMKVMSKAEYRAKYYHEDLETAQQKVDEIEEFSIPEGGEE